METDMCDHVVSTILRDISIEKSGMDGGDAEDTIMSKLHGADPFVRHQNSTIVSEPLGTTIGVIR